MIPHHLWNVQSGRPRDVSGSAAVRRLEAWAAPLIRRTHLPRSPAAPMMQIAIGLAGMWFTGSLLNDDDVMAVRPLAVAATVFGAALVIPALGMVLEGAWMLGREPLRFFSPLWYGRLLPATAERG